METVTWRRMQYFIRGEGIPPPREPRWLVFNPSEKMDEQFAAALRERGGKVTVVEKGAAIQNVSTTVVSRLIPPRSRSRPGVQDVMKRWAKSSVCRSSISAMPRRSASRNGRRNIAAESTTRSTRRLC